MSLRHRSRGFTLIELLIVIAVIALIAALIIPNLLDALQKAKQKKSQGQLKIAGTAMMAWLTDQAGAAAAAGQASTIDLTVIPQISIGDLETILVPSYIQELPAEDAWNEPLEYRLNVDDAYAATVLSVRSFGRDRTPEGSEYEASAFDPTDYDRDLVWVDGGFVRWPQRGFDDEEGDGGG